MCNNNKAAPLEGYKLKNERTLVLHDHFENDGEYHDYMMKLYPDSGLEMPIPITFQITEACNLQCKYCYQICKSPKVMSLDVAKRAVDLILTDEKYVKSQSRIACILDFIGGEPLLEPDLMIQTYEYFLKRCYELNHPWLFRHRVNFCSNGVLWFDQRVRDFINKYRKTLSISISIDGPKELHDSCRVFPDGRGSHDIVEKAVKDAVENGWFNSTKATISPENLPYLKDTVKYFYETLGFNAVHANCTYEGPWDLNTANMYYHNLIDIADYCYENDTYSNFSLSIFCEHAYCDKNLAVDNDNWCGGTGKMFAIDPDGQCYPCLRYMKSSLGEGVKPLIIGNVYDGLLTDVSQCELCKYMDSITWSSQSTQECIDCPIKDFCAWCSAYNYQTTGSLNKRVINICVMHKAAALANSYYWNRFYEKHHVNCVHELFLPEKDAVEIIGKTEYDKLISVIEEQRKRVR